MPLLCSIKRPTISTLTVDIANKEISCVDMKALVGPDPLPLPPCASVSLAVLPGGWQPPDLPVLLCPL